MTIGVGLGARIAGSLVVGAAGQGNCEATISEPSATRIVDPFCAGVTVIVPCAMLGDEADDGDGECVVAAEVGAGADGALDVVPEPESEAVGLPEAVPVPAP